MTYFEEEPAWGVFGEVEITQYVMFVGVECRLNLGFQSDTISYLRLYLAIWRLIIGCCWSPNVPFWAGGG